MQDTWIKETLTPDSNSIAELTEGARAPDLKRKLQSIKSEVAIHYPRSKFLDESQTKEFSVSSSDSRYLLVRLGCEFSPGRRPKATFTDAFLYISLWPEEKSSVRIYSIAPIGLTTGEPQLITVKFGPSVKTPAGAGFSLGEISTNIMVGQVAPTVTGFFSRDENDPHWELKHHGTSPIYGVRNFWLWLEIPNHMKQCRVSCRLEGYYQTLAGKLLMVPEKRTMDHRPKIDLIKIAN